MKSYKYRYVQNLPLNNEPEEIRARMLYSFKSTQTKQTYWVMVDKCLHNIYVIKFHLKAHRHSPHKYNILTNLHEARTVLFTCMNIVWNEVQVKDDRASLGFVGANMLGESTSNTKRYRFYRKFVQTHVNINTYEHYTNEEKSAYILIPHKALEDNPNLPDIYLEMLEHYEEQGGEL